MPTPVVVVSGFLGAGKTTLINRFLSTHQRIRAGILCNEAGSESYEAWNYHHDVYRLENLHAPCLTCLGVDRFAMALSRLIRRSKARVVLIEASGLTHLPTLIHRLEAPQLQNLVQFAGVIHVVDALNGRRQLDLYPEAKSGLRYASLVFLSKADGIPPVEREDLIHDLKKIRPDLTVCDHPDRLPWTSLLATHYPRSENNTFFQKHVHSDLSFLEYFQDRPLTLEGFKAFLKKPRENLYRIKGQLYLRHPSARFNRYIINHAFAQTRLDARPWPLFRRKTTRLLLVGNGLNQDELFQELDALIG